MKKLDDLIFKILCWTCAALLFLMMAVIFGQVLARYAFQHSLTWSEEMGRFIFVWITFLGMVAAFKAGAHVALDILPNYLKGWPGHALRIFNGLLILLFSAAFFISGLTLVELGVGQDSPAMLLPMDKIYLVFPISGALMIYFSSRALWDYCISIKKTEN